MKARWLGPIQFALLVATAGIVLFFFQTRALDVEQHNRRVELMLQLKQTEGDLDRDVLRAASFLLLQYDPFVTELHRIRELSTQLHAAEKALAGAEGRLFREGVAAYGAALEEKLGLVERIKAKAALVRNGLHYLPLVVGELYARDSRLGTQVSRLLNEQYRYNLLPSALDAQEVAERIDELEFFSEVGDRERPVFDNTLFHLRANLRLMSELAELRARYTQVPSGARFDAMYAAYTGHYTAQTRRSEAYSLLLLAITVSLFVGLGLALRKVYAARAKAERARDQLGDAVESLSEAFALFAPDGRLVLCNSKYTELYPWLEERLRTGMNLEEILELNARSGAFVEEGVQGNRYPFPHPQLPCRQANSYIEQLRDGRWYLASDTCTSAGEVACVRVDITESKRTEQELRKLYRALEQSPASVVITDTQGNIEYVNPRFEETTGYNADEALGRNPRILKSGDKSPEEYRDLWETITAGKVWRGQFHNKRKDGAIYWEAASISPVRDGEGRITHYIAVKEDITARKRAEDQLRLNATVFETTTEGIMVTDADTRIKAVNPAFTRITGYQPEEVIGRKPGVLSSGRHDQAFYGQLWASLNRKGYWSGEIWNRRKDGSVYPEWLSLAAIRNDGQGVQEYVAVFSDITRRKQDEEQIRRQANYDALTGLPNRSLLVDRLGRSLTSARREQWVVALLFVDLDRFKGVNDTLGHVVGDELLQQVAGRLQGCVREADTVARFGGDEFVIVLEDIAKADDAAEVAKKVIATLDRPFTLAGREVFIGASIGITLYPEDSTDADTMLRNADMAMYRAKDAGRNNYQFFTFSMNEQVHSRMELERDLRLALERDQLSLLYQPVVRIEDHELLAVEALLRWEHPAHGLVAPDRFIPLAEETGLIGPIGRWVLRNACAQAAAWREAGVDIKVNVNLSSRQLALGLSTAEVKELLQQTGLPAFLLTLELTEGLLLEGDASTLAWLQSIKSLGIGLAVDDFGTGYSSLSYLKRFPMDVLKIDRSFVAELPHNKGDASLVQAILAMARSLGLSVVAEGVETPEQLEFLSQGGCVCAQGYLFSPPTTATEVLQLGGRPFALAVAAGPSRKPAQPI